MNKIDGNIGFINTLSKFLYFHSYFHSFWIDIYKFECICEN